MTLKSVIIAPAQGVRHLALLEQLKELTDVELFPARMLKELPGDFDLGLARLLNNVDPKPGEVGCAQSHRDLSIEFSQGHEEWMLVFEDDARIIDSEGLKRFTADLNLRAFGEEPVLISLYTEGGVIAEWPDGPFASCVIEPSFAVAYCVNREAARRLAVANSHLGFRADWPRDSGVNFYLYLPTFVAHGDETTGSIIGDRLASRISRPLTRKNMSIEVVNNRFRLYFTNYLRNKSSFRGYREYFRKVLRHRLYWHVARLLFRRNRLFAQVYVMSLKRRTSLWTE